MAEQHSKRPKLTREERLALMAPEILDIEGAATLLAVSSSTIYSLARQGKIPATRVGRESRFARSNLIQWVANGSQADQVAALLKKGKVAKRGR